MTAQAPPPPTRPQAPPPGPGAAAPHTPRPAGEGPRAVLPSTRGWPLFDVAATRQLEAQALAAQPPHALMARAGAAVARLAVACAPGARSVLALAGPGNNGGDAVVAACALRALGWDARIVLLADPRRLPADAAWALARAQAQGLPIAEARPAALDADLLLDGLLGVGATRAPDGALADAIGALNGADRPVLAIDVPSGLHPDHGTPLGTQAVRARHTLALLTLKPGLFTADGRDHAGRVWLDDLDVAVPDSPMRLSAPPPAAGGAGAPHAPHASHKGRFGDVAVVGGAPGMAGAALLAARAALAAGAGRVFLATLDGAPPAVDPVWPELMQRPLGALLAPARLATLTVAAGCGGGEAVAATLPPLIAHAQRLLLDADALNAVAGDTMLATALAARGRHGRPTLLTPHPLEAARLLGVGVAEVQRDRLGAARTLADRFGAVTVLKGSGSVIAAPDGRLRLNPTGNALLAAAGTGDVLAGWTAGRWARGAGPALETAEAAVHAHGVVADRVAARGDAPPALRASEIVDALRSAPG